MRFISYAQNFEDVMLWRALKHVEIGFYVDVGANDPQHDSVTKAFYERGWRGINIEPVSQWFNRLVSERTRDINLQVAVGAQSGETIIYDLPDTGLSTMDKSIAERHETERGYRKVEYKVHVKTLTEICINLHIAPIHFLKIDVEGAENEVLEGIDFSKLRPWIVVVESTLPNTQIEDYANWEPILLNANYDYVYFDGLNRFYVAQEHPELRKSFITPPNVFDDFATQEVSIANAHIEYLTLQLDEINRMMTEQNSTIVEQQINNQHQTLQLDELNQKLTETQTALTEQQARAQHLQDEWNTANAKIDELNHSSQHWWTVADGLNQEMQAAYHSKSWRITGPLRMVMKFLRQLSFFLLRMVRWMLSLPKRIVKRTVSIAVLYVLARPSLKAKGTNLLAKHPEFKARLRSVVSNNGILVHRSGSAEPSRLPIPDQSENLHLNPNIAQLSSHARHIYEDLTGAIAKHQKEDN